MFSNEETKGNKLLYKATLSSKKNKQITDNSQMELERTQSSASSCVSMATEWSKTEPIYFSSVSSESKIQIELERPESPPSSCVSMATEWSKTEPVDFNSVSLESKMCNEKSKEEPTEFKEEGPCIHEMLGRLSSLSNQRRSEISSGHKYKLDSVFKVLEDDIIHFVKIELRKLKNMLNPASSGKYNENNEQTTSKEEQISSNRDAFLQICLSFLKRRNEDQMADSLQKKTQAAIGQGKLKSNLNRKFQHFFEGNVQGGGPTFVNQIYTELRITERGKGEINDGHEVQQMEAAFCKPDGSETTISCKDIFKPGRDGQIRTLVTKGVAGIGKTVLTQKYILDWAEGKANHNIQFIFPFTFRELNLLKSKLLSLVGLIHYFFPEIKEAGVCQFEEFLVVFIFDGLDELQPPLNFHDTQILTDVTEPASIHMLLVNLIRGKLLPSACVWITTRPAEANLIPFQYVDIETEVRGFTDLRKEEYFRKRYQDKDKANRIISHIETLKSLHVMCHIPVFTWITATVLDQVLNDEEKTELPKTLTELYIHFLVIQVKQDSAKYKKMLTDLIWNSDTKNIILALGKLAYEQLEKRNLIFCEEELKVYDIDVNTASAYIGLFTEIFKEDRMLNQERVFCFVHRSIQEFLAALYVFLVFLKTGDNLLKRNRMLLQRESKFKQFYQSAVDKALESPNGYLDMFTRFLLGLSWKTNQDLLRGLIKKNTHVPPVQEMVIQYIKKNIRTCPSAEKSIRMFYWLNELNDHSLEEEIQLYLRGNMYAEELTSSQWSALVFVLLSSQKNIDIFDLKKFPKSEEALVWLLPVVKASKKSLLCSCNLSMRGCIPLVSMLTAENSCLRELDLSDNDLRDDGVNLLSQGLMSPKCRLEVLSLSGCMVTEKGCASLASALTSNPSYLTELDLSFNHPGESGLNIISAGLQDLNWKLKTLKTDHCGKLRLNPSPQRFFLKQTLDPNTANPNLLLCEDNKHVDAVKEKQPYADHPERFDTLKQLLCSDGLTGRCYWEVRWRGSVRIGLTYKKNSRKGGSDDCCIGGNNQSWCISCTPKGFTAWHNNIPTDIKELQTINSNRLAVYLDWSAGTVSFYLLPQVVSSIKKIHLHTFQAAFTEPLYAAFGFGGTQELENESSSVSLTDVEQ